MGPFIVMMSCEQLNLNNNVVSRRGVELHTIFSNAGEWAKVCFCYFNLSVCDSLLAVVMIIIMCVRCGCWTLVTCNQ